jgi:4-amino-4-deoxy-L-arabinose transferase-like glycosyltransferase
VVLISAAHKNDTLLGACTLAAIHWTARWAARGERAALVLAAIGTSLAVGTKVSGGVLAPALAPLVLWRVRSWRRDGGPLSLRNAALWTTGAVAIFLLLGGATYAVNLLQMGRPLPAMKNAGGYGDWKHLWMFPYLVFARPLSMENASWVPWEHKYWFWPEWDLFFSTYGLPTTLAILGLPFALARYRTSGLTTERALAAIAALLAWVAILPIRFDPHPEGFFEGLVRYTYFFPAILLALTVAPLVLELARSRRRRSFALSAVVGAGVVYAYVAVHSAVDDAYAPIDFVATVFADPKYSRAIRTWTIRAGSWVDANAGPNDVIAFDGAFDAWIYPAYGADLSRRLIFLHSDGAPPTIPSEANWVAIDRSWSCVFGHPKFIDFGVWWKYILRGKPLPEDLVVYNQLLTDPQFKLVYRDDRANQAVFKRVPPREVSPE